MNVNYEVRNVLRSIGISPDLNGYFYLADAITAVMEDMRERKRVRQFIPLYKEIGRSYGFKDYGPVERCMRHAIIKAWTKRNEKFAEIIPDGEKAPSISVFVCYVSEYLIESEV